MSKTLHLAILGAGGLGKGMVNRVDQSPDFKTVALVDSGAYLFDPAGISYESIANLDSLCGHPDSVPSLQPILDLLNTHGDEIEAIFVALPNLPVDFIPNVIRDIARQTPFRGVMVDALKRTQALEAVLELDDLTREHQILYITGGGATPGFLSTIATVAAQSFVEVTHVDICFGVGISNWQAYRATIREDLIHLPGFSTEKVAMMTDEDIEVELDARNGILQLVNMEHADDIILERAGICRRDQVTVGGIVDTRNAKKPVSTQVTITGKTAAGVEASHVLTLDDNTTMVDNVCGPALGFLRQGYRLFHRSQFGVITSADIMPRGPVTVPVPAAV